MKFLADMGISPMAVEFLKHLGYLAIHLHQEGLHRMGDVEILEKARTEGYVLLTHDLDFGDLLAASGANLPSVILFRLRNMRPENVNRHLHEIVPQYTKPLEEGAILTVSEGRVRVRSLPVRIQ